MAARRRNAKKAASKKGAPKKPKVKKIKEPKEVSPRPPIEVVLCIVTGLMLLAAVILVDYSAGHNYGTGGLFADSYHAGE